ncbi:MAG: tetratricopeptide repeat protein [Bacteroidia bacterium]|nr:tetratricopeptide repeat protein [Bacteroidia bacterium]
MPTWFVHNLAVVLILSWQVLSGLVSHATAAPIDSLRQALADHPQRDSVRAELLVQLGKQLFHIPVEAERYGREAASIAKEVNYPKAEGQALSVQAISWAERGDYIKALDMFLRASELFKNANELRSQASALHNMAGIYYYQEKYTEARTKEEEALDIYTDYPDENRREIADGSFTMGLLEGALERPASALTFFLRAHSEYKALNDSARLGTLSTSIAHVYMAQREYAQAQVFLREAQEICTLTGNNSGLANAILAEGLLLKETGKLADARSRYLTVRKMAHALSIVRVELGAIAALSSLDSLEGNFRQAYLTRLEYERINDSLLRLTQSQEIQMLQEKFSLERTTRENELLKRENEVSETKSQARLALLIILVISTAILLGALVFTLSLWNQQRETNKALQLAQAEAAARSEELLALNHTKDKWFELVSYDFRGPIAFLENAIRMVNEGDLPEKDRRKLNAEIEFRISQTKNLLDNLIYWSQLQMQELKPRSRPVDLHNLFEMNISEVSIFMQKKQVTCLNRIPGHTAVWTDTEMITLVARNVLLFTISRSFAEGEVVITSQSAPAEVWVSLLYTGEKLDQVLLDQILGIEATETEIRIDSELRLSLQLISAFVAKNGGRLWAESSHTDQNRLTFALPAPSAGDA